MQVTPNLNISSYKQGHLEVSFERICQVLGKPNRDDDWGKVQYSWGYNVDGEPVACGTNGPRRNDGRAIVTVTRSLLTTTGRI